LADAKAALTGKLTPRGSLGLQRRAKAALSRRHPGQHRRRVVGPRHLEAGAIAGAHGVFGGYDAARYVHFFAMAAIVGFVVVHVVMALLVPKSLRAMITGR